jgi:uncharacterized protein with PQ loop repeat
MQPMPHPRTRKASPGQHDGLLDKLLPVLSVFTMLMTLPQVYAVWFEGNAAGVSLLSWSAYLLAACLWFFHGLQQHDKTIWVACIGWVIVDAAVVAGVLWRG